MLCRPPRARSKTALEAQSPSDVRRTQTHWASALVDLGIAELWSLRLDEARNHLEEAVEVARRIERPLLEIRSMSFLALVDTLTGRPASAGRPLVEQAASLADDYGWQTEDGAAAAFAVGANTLVWLGRFADAEQWLERADRALAQGGAPGVEVLVRHTSALLRLAQGRIEDALSAIGDAERLEGRLVSAHPFTRDSDSRALRAQVQLGKAPEVRATLADMSPDVRCTAEIRIAAAAMELADGCAEQAIEELAAGHRGLGASAYRESAVIEALLYDAAARSETGDMTGAEASLERALELAEPEGVLLPFVLVRVPELLERHRGHRTAHATLLLTILDLLAGSSPQAARWRCSIHSATPSCAWSGTCPATSRRPRSPTNSSSRRTPSGRTSGTSTPSWTSTPAERPLRAPASSVCWRPRESSPQAQLGRNHQEHVMTAHPARPDAGAMNDNTQHTNGGADGYTSAYNVIAVSFDPDNNAYAALTTLKQLDSQGQLRLEAAAVVERGDDGRSSSRTRSARSTASARRAAGSSVC